MNEQVKPKTPAHGPLEDVEPPVASTQEEVQESWHKAKNQRPAIKELT